MRKSGKGEKEKIRRAGEERDKNNNLNGNIQYFTTMVHME